jgi:hypothetical protein
MAYSVDSFLPVYVKPFVSLPIEGKEPDFGPHQFVGFPLVRLIRCLLHLICGSMFNSLHQCLVILVVSRFTSVGDLAAIAARLGQNVDLFGCHTL